MKIGVYFHLARVGRPLGDRKYRIQPTGVGQHTVQMIQGLRALPDAQLTAILPREELDYSGRIPDNFPMGSMPVAPLPFSRKSLETAWSMLNWPNVDRWCPGCDWIYCPQEAVVATRRAALAVTVHDTYYLEPDNPWRGGWDRAKARFRWKLLFGAIRRHARLVLAVSEFTKSRLVNLLGFDPDRIFVVGNPIDDLFFEPPPPSAENDPVLPPAPYLLVVGGLDTKKGGDYLLDAAKTLQSARPDMRIVVCGVSRSPYKERAAEMPNITLLGYESNERYSRLLRSARALLMLSRYEGFGLPAVEAMAAGTPAIVSRFASLPEVVDDGGIVVDADRPDDVVRSIDAVDKDSAFRAEIIAKGRQRATRFRRVAVAERLYAALQSAGEHGKIAAAR